MLDVQQVPESSMGDKRSWDLPEFSLCPWNPPAEPPGEAGLCPGTEMLQ